MKKLRLALAAFEIFRTPSKIQIFISNQGTSAIEDEVRKLTEALKKHLTQEAERLSDKGIDALFFTDPEFPPSLIRNGKPVTPILFYWGRREILNEPSVGMCGSRSASPLGLKAAHACGQEVSVRNHVVVSGYAKGVDTETHLAALQSGGRTAIVLAEGFDHFRVKQSFRQDFDRKRIVVISQFPPSQPWGAYAAMARNKLIYGLSRALVVVEAGEKGGTLAAGEGALKSGKPVFVLNFGDETPPGNKKLLAQGGHPITSRYDLGAALDGKLASTTVTQHQLPLM